MLYRVLTSAKLNLGITVISKREDGYHEIESIMVPVDIYDSLVIEFTLGDNTRNIVNFNQDLIPIPYGTSNVMFKVVDFVEKYLDIKVGCKIEIHKAIPVGSGLGGASGNAAGILMAIKDFLLRRGIVTEKVFNKVVSDIHNVGSDIPFFLYKDACLVQGKGEKIKVLPGLIDKLKDYRFLVVYPQVHISTKDAYDFISENALFNTKRWAEVFFRKFMDQKIGLKDFKNNLTNTFEQFRISDVIESIKNLLYEEGSMFSLMTGSGSAVFGIFELRDSLENVKQKVINKFNLSPSFVFISRVTRESFKFF